MSVVVVQLADVRCGLPTQAVVELLPMLLVTPLPRAPGLVEGVIDLRGTVVAVIDLRRRFGLPTRPRSATDHLVVTRAGDRIVAVRVDRVVEIVSVPRDRVEDVDGLGADRSATGAVRLADGLVFIHDVTAFLSADESLDLDAAVAAAGRDRP